MYDAVESLFQKVRDYLERVSIHLEPATPPSPALLNVLGETLTHIFTVFSLATRYCTLVAERDSWFKRVLRLFARRTSEFYCRFSESVTLTQCSEEDYFRVLVDKTGAQEILDKLDALTDKEQLVFAASTYAAIRKGQNDLLSTFSPDAHRRYSPIARGVRLRSGR